MAGYDPTKDVKLKEINYTKIDDKTDVEIAVYQYNGGAKKIRVTKVTKGSGEKRYHEVLCKMTLPEFVALVNEAPEIMEVMK